MSRQDHRRARHNGEGEEEDGATRWRRGGGGWSGVAAEDDTVVWSGGASAQRVSHDRDREVRVPGAFYMQVDGCWAAWAVPQRATWAGRRASMGRAIWVVPCLAQRAWVEA
jgi:hypothetical protein